jgi:acetyl esterase/lipase
MEDAVKFDFPVTDARVRGQLHIPNGHAESDGLPSVLLCRGVHGHGDSTQPLVDAIIAGLHSIDVAAVTFEHRCADLILEDFDRHTALHDVEDAQAVLNWMRSRKELDRQRISVMGYSLGAVAAGLLADTNHDLNGVCLLAAPTMEFLRDLKTDAEDESAATSDDRLPAAWLPSLDDVDYESALARCRQPMLVLHGAADRTIPVEHTFQLVNALRAAGRTVEHLLVAQGDHVFSSVESRVACVEPLKRFVQNLPAPPVKKPAALVRA